MGNRDEQSRTQRVDFYLDITQEVCPFTFVRTKLLIEQMQPGQVAEIRLRGTEPLQNVPRAVRTQGHEVIALAPETSAPIDGTHRLLMRKV